MLVRLLILVKNRDFIFIIAVCRTSEVNKAALYKVAGELLTQCSFLNISTASELNMMHMNGESCNF